MCIHLVLNIIYCTCDIRTDNEDSCSSSSEFMSDAEPGNDTSECWETVSTCSSVFSYTAANTATAAHDNNSNTFLMYFNRLGTDCCFLTLEKIDEVDYA